MREMQEVYLDIGEHKTRVIASYQNREKKFREQIVSLQDEAYMASAQNKALDVYNNLLKHEIEMLKLQKTLIEVKKPQTEAESTPQGVTSIDFAKIREEMEKMKPNQ